tara:strand:+ start:113 stop:628 length:516 start_codon:yes stop_codon:yes gene_type:complete
MGRLGLALKVLFNSNAAEKAQAAILGNEASALPKPKPAPEPEPAPVRSDAITLLASLQREARFLDFIQEPIDAYSDDQVGAAVRDIHRGSVDVIQRMFAPQPVVDEPEESTVQVDDQSSAVWRLTGNVGQSDGSVSGRLTHHGWKATQCHVPEWTGDESGSLIIAPAEVEV